MNKRPASKLIIRIIIFASVGLLTLALTGCTAAETVTQPPASPTPAASQTTQPAASTKVPSPTLSPSTTEAVDTTAATTSSPSPTPTPTPTLPPTPMEKPWSTVVYTPTAEPYNPDAAHAELFQYMLDFINADRKASGLPPVTLGYNAAAQQHAQDMLNNHYVAHWGTDGLKPYMRWTESGGINYEQENSAYSESSNAVNVKNELKALQAAMMAEVAPNDGHRTNILNKWHTRVNLGIAYDNNQVALVQQFEGEYIEFYQPPAIDGNILTVSGRFTHPGMVLNNVTIFFDELPQPLTGDQLQNGPDYHHYSLGQALGYVFAPPPAGSKYTSLPANSVVATRGSADKNGEFFLEADISLLLQNGKGVYTFALVPDLGSDTRNFSNFSVRVE